MLGKLSNDILKNIIEAIPENVFFKDSSCRYQMVSYICSILNGGNEEWSIHGKTDYEVQNDPELAQSDYNTLSVIMCDTYESNNGRSLFFCCWCEIKEIKIR